MPVTPTESAGVYEAPLLVELGGLAELTLCNKDFGPTDGNMFQGSPISCGSA
jgi:hypothetical protein